MMQQKKLKMLSTSSSSNTKFGLCEFFFVFLCSLNVDIIDGRFNLGRARSRASKFVGPSDRVAGRNLRRRANAEY